MNIYETKIPNVIPETIDESKMILADNIIKNVYPLFDEIYKSRSNGLRNVENELTAVKSKVLEEKDNLESLMASYNRHKKISKLLDRIEKLIASGLIYDGTLKRETTVLLKVILKMDEEKLDHHSREILQLINKRFSR